MSGHKKFSEIRAKKPTTVGYEERLAELSRAMDTAIALNSLRQSRGVTQVEMAEAMGKTQGNISRIERSYDLYLSTLRMFVESLGGHLELRAVFEDEVVNIIDPTDRNDRPSGAVPSPVVVQ